MRACRPTSRPNWAPPSRSSTIWSIADRPPPKGFPLPVTVLDANTALLVVDLQKGIVALPLADPIDDVVARAADLVRAFRAHQLPVVLINATGIAPGRTEQPARLTGDLPAGFA